MNWPATELATVQVEPIHGHMLDVAAAARMPPAGPVWQAFRKALATDPDARLSGASPL